MLEARRAERDMRNGNVAARHEEVRHVARVEAAVRNGIRPYLLVERVGLVRLAVEFRLLSRLGKMQVDRPCRGACAVWLEVPGPEVVLVEYEVPEQTARLAAA